MEQKIENLNKGDTLDSTVLLTIHDSFKNDAPLTIISATSPVTYVLMTYSTADTQTNNQQTTHKEWSTVRNYSCTQPRRQCDSSGDMTTEGLGKLIFTGVPVDTYFQIYFNIVKLDQMISKLSKQKLKIIGLGLQ